MRSMFGIRYKPHAEILRPFRAWVSWHCFIGLHPMLRYAALSGHFINSSEGAAYANDGHRPSGKKIPSSTTSSEGARYNSPSQLKKEKL